MVNPIPNPNQVRAALADCRESFAAAGWEAQCERVLRCNAAMCRQPYKPEPYKPSPPYVSLALHTLALQSLSLPLARTPTLTLLILIRILLALTQALTLPLGA